MVYSRIEVMILVQVIFYSKLTNNGISTLKIPTKYTRLKKPEVFASVINQKHPVKEGHCFKISLFVICRVTTLSLVGRRPNIT